jgi:hypothetical protein
MNHLAWITGAIDGSTPLILGTGIIIGIITTWLALRGSLGGRLKLGQGQQRKSQP